jgi:opacity protein-like surface antigen
MHVRGGWIAALVLAAAAPAWAQDTGYGYRFRTDSDPGISAYAGLRGSLAFSGNAKTTIPTTPPAALRASYNTGGGGSVFLGAKLPFGLRLEAEGLVRYLPFDQVTTGTPAVARGHTSVVAPMANLMWDLPIPDFPVRPFIGAGIGGANVSANLRDATNANTYLKSDNWGMAYQLMGGASFPVTQNTRFTAMYRWLQVDNVHAACGTSGAPTLSCRSSLNSQSVDLGLEMDL